MIVKFRKDLHNLIEEGIHLRGLFEDKNPEFRWYQDGEAKSWQLKVNKVLQGTQYEYKWSLDIELKRNQEDLLLDWLGTRLEILERIIRDSLL